MGAAAARASRRGSCGVRARAHARQARNRPVGSRPRGAAARNDDGRCTRCDGRGGFAIRCSLDRWDEHGYRCALCGHLSRALRRPHHLRPQDERNSIVRLPVGSDGGGLARAAHGRTRRLGGTWLPRKPRSRVGTGGGRGRAIPQLVRHAHASESQPRRSADVIPHRDGARRAGRPCGGSCPDARHSAPRAPCPWSLHRRANPRIGGRRVAGTAGCLHVGRRRGAPGDDGGNSTLCLTSHRAVESERILATILFTDIVGSTELAARVGDSAWRELLQRHHGLVRRELARFQGREIDTAGDGFFAAFDGPARAVRAAAAIRDSLGELEIAIRAGLHSGECEVADGKVAGIAVSIGARIAALAEPGEVLVSSTVKDLVAGSDLGSGIAASTTSKAYLSRGACSR